MSDDFEAFVGEELTGIAAAGPDGFDGAALTGRALTAARRRRRRQIAAATGAAGVLVLGTALLLPWWGLSQEPAPAATGSAAGGLGIEFVVADAEGYAVVNGDGERVRLPDAEPSAVIRTDRSYLVVSEPDQVTVASGLDGTIRAEHPWPGPETSTVVNAAGTEFALVSATEGADILEYELIAVSDVLEALSFKVAADLILVDWTDSVAVFHTELDPVTESGEYASALDALGEAGFGTVAVFDTDDPERVCLADLDDEKPIGDGAQHCGRINAADMEAAIGAVGGAAIVTDAVARAALANDRESTGADPGELADAYTAADVRWTDPGMRWEMACDSARSTWILIDHSAGGAPAASMVDPPDGALMPVLDAARAADLGTEGAK